METALVVKDLIVGKSHFEMVEDALQHAGENCKTLAWIEKFIESKYSVNPRTFKSSLTRALAKGVESRLFQLVPAVAGGPLYKIRRNEDEERATALANVLWLFLENAKEKVDAIFPRNDAELDNDMAEIGHLIDQLD